MQPNQQDSNNSSQPTPPPQPTPVRLDPYGRPLPADQIQPVSQGVPEYLHMEPIAEPKAKKNPLLIFLPIIVLIIVGAIGAAAYMLMQQNTPQQKFYKVLENQMSVSYVSANYSITKKSSNTVTSLKSETNLSDPAKPTSYITYTRTQTGTDSVKKMTSGENVIGSTSEYSAILKVDDFKTSGKNVALNQWYRIPINSKDRTSLSYDLDDEGSRLMINSVQGVVPTGNFNDKQRQSLLATIKTQGVYSLLAVQDDSKQTIYTVGLNRAALNELNKQAAELLDINQVHLISTAQLSNDRLQFVVDNQTQKIVKMNYVVKNSKNEATFEKNIDFKYPANVTIINPTDVKDLPK